MVADYAIWRLRVLSTRMANLAAEVMSLPYSKTPS